MTILRLTLAAATAFRMTGVVGFVNQALALSLRYILQHLIAPFYENTGGNDYDKITTDRLCGDKA
jgi:hypothetical protein